MVGYKDFFNGKRITVLGLGLLGRGLGDTRFLAELGAEIIVTDMKSREQLRESVELLQHLPNITFHLGGHRLEDFRDCDMILKAAGVPHDSIYIAEAKKNGIPVRMSADLFAEFARVPIVGVTGTRGKSTVTHLIAHILQTPSADGSTPAREVLLGGNVRGVSTLSLLPQVTPNTIAVLELDSWQMQGFGDARMSPQVAVFTTFFPDHLNYYGDGAGMRLYFADKANIFLHQDESDTLVLGEQVAPFVQEYGYQNKIRANTILAGAKNLPKGIALKVLGEHNRYNAGLAAEAARALGVDDETIKVALESFPGLPGRLEFLREVHGVKIYNDNNSTTPDATLAALRAFGDTSNIILILGGSDKGLDMSALVEEIPKHCKSVLLLPGTGTERIAAHLPQAQTCTSLEEVVADAFAHAAPGDVILFSPAFASFGMFKNEYDRNDQFVALVGKM